MAFGDDIDWKETELLVNRLRARMAEDDAETADDVPPAVPALPQETATPERVTNPQKRKKRTRRAASAASDSAPEMAAEPVAETVPEMAAEPVAETVPEMAAEPVADTVPEMAAEPVAETVPEIAAEPVAETVPEIAAEPVAEVVPEMAAEPADPQKPKAKQRRKRTAVPPATRTTMFAASYEGQATSAFSKPVQSPVPPVSAVPTSESVPQHARTESELRARETVDTILHDLFGEDSGWFDTAVPSTHEDAQEPAKPMTAAASVPDVQGEAPSSDAIPVGSETAETVSVQEPVETITRTRDGQIALVLPETGRPLAIPAEGSGEARPVAVETERPAEDDAQLDMFANGETTAVGDALEDLEGFCRKMEDSEDEFRFLLDMGYENELGNAIGFEKIRLYHEQGVNGLPPPKKRRRRKSTEPREYETQGQDISLRKVYADKKREHLIRVALSGLLALLILFYERTGWMARLFGGPFDGTKYPASYILLGLQLLIVAAFFSKKRLIEGFLRLIRFSPIDYSLCSVVLLATVCYHTVLIFLPHEAAPALYLSPAAMMILLLSLTDLMDWYREFRAFLVVSSRKQKYALIPRASVGGQQGNARAALRDDDRAQAVWHVRPVGFVRRYFANTDKRIEHTAALGAQLLLIAALGLAMGLYTFAVGGSLPVALQTFFVTFLLCVPVSSLLLTSLPMFLGVCMRLKRIGAIVGEVPISDCGGSTTLVLPDAETFAAMPHQRYETVEDAGAAQIDPLVRAFLEKLQSPLYDSVAVSRDRRISPDLVSVTEICDEGAAATVGEQAVPMLIGNMSYLQAHGVTVELREGLELGNADRRLVCVAANGQLVALFLARYRLHDKMLDLIRELETEDVRICVRTKDPGVEEELFRTLMPDHKEPIRVMKPTASETDLRTDRVDATVVALESCRNAAHAFVTCRRIRRAGKVGRVLQVLSMIAGAMIAVGLTFTGGAITLSAVPVFLYMLFWCGVHAATSYFCLRGRIDE